jgi:hypothetical protein
MASDRHRILHINAAKIAHETIEDEVLIINTDSGCYLSLRGVAAALWAELGGAPSAAGLAAVAQRRWGGDPAAIAAAVDDYVAALMRDEVLVLGDPAPPDADAPAAAAGPAAPAEAFVAPVIERFTDMADLLTLDPIHDVDSAGWPHVARD